MLHILLAISIVCVVALIWVALAIARHIGASRRTARWNSDDITSILQHVDAYHAPQSSLREQWSIPKFRESREFRHEFVAAAQIDTRIPQSDLRQSARDISANKAWTMPLKPLKTRAVATNAQAAANPKSTPAARHGLMRRLDPAYFNKDSGDLTDPYEQPRTVTRPLYKRMNHSHR